MYCAKTKRTFFFLQYISLFCPYIDNSFIVSQIISRFGFQTVPVVKILVDIVNIFVIQDMHVKRKDVVAGICTCMFLHFTFLTVMGQNLLPVRPANSTCQRIHSSRLILFIRPYWIEDKIPSGNWPCSRS